MGKFSLIKPIENSVTPITLNKSLGGDLIILNMGTKKIKAPGSIYDKIPVASQAILKKVYDNGPESAQIIEAPPGYKPPWQRFSEEEEEE